MHGILQEPLAKEMLVGSHLPNLSLAYLELLEEALVAEVLELGLAWVADAPCGGVCVWVSREQAGRTLQDGGGGGATTSITKLVGEAGHLIVVFSIK